jgi:ferric-dicitrate binding protein FerR (iron transport regulator)
MNTSASSPASQAPVHAERRRFSMRRTRIGGWWVALVAAAFVLLSALAPVTPQSNDCREMPGSRGRLGDAAGLPDLRLGPPCAPSR